MSKPFLDLTAEASTLVEVLRWRAIHQPSKRAYTFLVDGETEELHLTYDELDRQARAIAYCLQLYGSTGERALLLYPSGLEYIAAFVGCLYAEVVAVPAYPPRLNRSLLRLQTIVTDSQATVGLSTTAVISRMRPLLAQIPSLKDLRWLETDGIAYDFAIEWREPTINSNTLALLQYTSGSTAEPKGVMVSHGNLLHNERMMQRALEMTEQSTSVGWLPLYHDMGLIGNVLQPLCVGATGILMAPEAFLLRPFRWLQNISRYKAYASCGPNFAYDLCVRKITPEQRATLDLSSWEVALNGSEPVRVETLDRFAQTFEPCGFRREAFYPCYGLAEATLFVTGSLTASQPVIHTVQQVALDQNKVAAAAKDAGTRSLVSCGHSAPDQKIVIVDPERATRCRSDEVGEIWVSGSSVALGYWNRAEETNETFRAYLADTEEGPFLRTGDLGFVWNNEFFVTGRLKDLIIIAGRNHYPQDIESTAEQSHPALRSGCCAAFSVDFAGEERLIVVAEVDRRYRLARLPKVQLNHYQSLNVDEVVTAIRRAVAEDHDLTVDTVLLLKTGSIPKTSNGKIQRHACRSRFLDRSLEAVMG